MFYRFHVNIFGQPFSCSWEQAADALKQFPRMIFEPDGSWILSGGVGRERWQIDGHLFDFDDRLHRVELHGECPQSDFDELLACFGWPETELAYEHVLLGTKVTESEFRAEVEVSAR